MIILRIMMLFGVSAMLSSCAGYRIGGHKPQALAHVQTIHVPIARNSTQIPRAAAFVTNNVVDALVRDGSYRVGTVERSEAILNVEFFEIKYDSVRNDEDNTLRSVELAMTVVLRWNLVDADSASKVLDSGTSIGRTTFFVDPNLQTARQTAINDALQRASTSLISRLADGF